MNEESTSSVAAEGVAFPLLVRGLISGTTLSVFIAAMFALPEASLHSAPWGTKLLIASGLFMLLVFNYWVLRSRIRIDAHQIEQSWVWRKRVLWSDVVQTKMIYVPWLSWLIAPRLVVRSRSGLVTLFHASDHQVLAAFAHYALAPPLINGA